MVITSPADGLAPNGARPSAGAVLTTMLHIFWVSLAINDFESPLFKFVDKMNIHNQILRYLTAHLVFRFSSDSPSCISPCSPGPPVTSVQCATRPTLRPPASDVTSATSTWTWSSIPVPSADVISAASPTWNATWHAFTASRLSPVKSALRLLQLKQS